MFRVLRQVEGLWQPRLRWALLIGEGSDEGQGSEGAGGGGGQTDQGGQPGSGDQGREQQDRASSGDTGRRTDASGHMIPKHRFDEVNSTLGKYRGYGSPEDIDKKLKRLAELEKQSGGYTSSEEQAIRKDLMKIFPEFGMLTQMYQTQREAYVGQGQEANKKFLQELGIEVNEQSNHYMQEMLSGVIASDPALLKRFYALDPSVYKEAFDKAKKLFWPNARRVPGLDTAAKKVGATQRQPPQGATGKQPASTTTETKPPGNPMLAERNALDEASDAAFALISQRGEE